jgi:hypothetical protein
MSRQLITVFQFHIYTSDNVPLKVPFERFEITTHCQDHVFVIITILALLLLLFEEFLFNKRREFISLYDEQHAISNRIFLALYSIAKKLFHVRIT